eukprot:11433749-Ditylum_brightwellii.AAC.1
MKAISKKKGEMREVDLPKTLIVSLFEDEDVKKAIRASVSSTEVIKLVLPAEKKGTQALGMPFVAPKKQVNMTAALLCCLNLPNKNKGEA